MAGIGILVLWIMYVLTWILTVEWDSHGRWKGARLPLRVWAGANFIGAWAFGIWAVFIQ